MSIIHPEKIKNNKKGQFFICEACNYSCKTKFLFQQHCSTKKHKRNTGENAPVDTKIHICHSGKQYNHIQSYKRHVRACNKELAIPQTNNKSIDDELRTVITN